MMVITNIKVGLRKWSLVWKCITSIPTLFIWKCITSIPTHFIWKCITSIPTHFIWKCITSIPTHFIWNNRQSPKWRWYKTVKFSLTKLTCTESVLNKNMFTKMKQNNNKASRYAELWIYSRGQNSFRFPWKFLIYFSPVNGANSHMDLLSLNGTNSN